MLHQTTLKLHQFEVSLNIFLELFKKKNSNNGMDVGMSRTNGKIIGVFRQLAWYNSP